VGLPFSGIENKDANFRLPVKHVAELSSAHLCLFRENENSGKVMPRIAINVVRYNQDVELISKCLKSALNQSFDDYNVTLTENGSSDNIEDVILAQFGSHPKFRYVDNQRNLGFSGAHNRFIRDSCSEFVLPLNPDAAMPTTYIRSLLDAFDDPLVAAAEGKMLKPEPLSDHSWVLDGTGMTISRARRSRERGQLEIDRNQYDVDTDVFGVSATAAMYRKSALEKVKFAESEYFDEDFFTYWEDLDLSWRLRLAGYRCVYVPAAIVFHSRAAGRTKHGFKRPVELVRHTRSLPMKVVYWDWRNHLFAIIKNDFGSSLLRDIPFIVGRELLLFGYLVMVRPGTIAAIPQFFKLLPRILEKRRVIHAHRVAKSKDMEQWFGRT
jgi:GT2 family glycosyltransferase